MSLSENKKIDQLTYEEAFAELDEIVTALESTPAPLDETMKLFERGQKLMQRCAELLEKAELRLQMLDEMDENTGQSNWYRLRMLIKPDDEFWRWVIPGESAGVCMYRNGRVFRNWVTQIS